MNAPVIAIVSMSPSFDHSPEQEHSHRSQMGRIILTSDTGTPPGLLARQRPQWNGRYQHVTVVPNVA